MSVYHCDGHLSLWWKLITVMKSLGWKCDENRKKLMETDEHLSLLRNFFTVGKFDHCDEKFKIYPWNKNYKMS